MTHNPMGIDALLCLPSLSASVMVVDPLATAVAAANIKLLPMSAPPPTALHPKRALQLPPLMAKLSSSPMAMSLRLPPLQNVDGAKIRETKPDYRDDTLVVARDTADRWREENQAMFMRIRNFIKESGLSDAQVMELVPRSFFRHAYLLKGKRQALFLQLVWLSLNQKVSLTLSPSMDIGYLGIMEVRVAAEHIAAFDAMPIPTQRAIKQRGSRPLQTLAALWREATFKESVTSDGGLLMKHVPYEPKTEKQRLRHALSMQHRAKSSRS